MRNLNGKVAVVTGTASGIGRALACALAREGCKLAISDIDEAGLEETREMVEVLGAEVHTAKLDVADREAFYAYADQIIKHYGQVELVINNAGVAYASTVEDMDYGHFEWLMGINFWGMVYGTKAFLPHLKQANEAHLVNVSSLFGVIAMPTQSAYNAAKFAIRGYTESLSEELYLERHPMGVSVVIPGAINTNIARRARMGNLGAISESRDEAVDKFEGLPFQHSPDKAADVIIRGIKKKKKRILIGPEAHIADFIQRMFPSRYQKLAAKSMTWR